MSRASPPSPPDYRRSAPPRGTRKDRPRKRVRAVNPTVWTRPRYAAAIQPAGTLVFPEKPPAILRPAPYAQVPRTSFAGFIPKTFPTRSFLAYFAGKLVLLSPVPGLALQSPGLIGTTCLLGQKTTLNVVVKSWGRVIRKAVHRLAEFVKAEKTVVRFVRR